MKVKLAEKLREKEAKITKLEEDIKGMNDKMGNKVIFMLSIYILYI